MSWSVYDYRRLAGIEDDARAASGRLREGENCQGIYVANPQAAVAVAGAVAIAGGAKTAI